MTFDANVVGGNGGRGVAVTNAPDGTTLKKNTLLGNETDGLFVDTSVLTTSVVQIRRSATAAPD